MKGTIWPSENWIFVKSLQAYRFDGEVRWIAKGGILLAIVHKSRIRNPTTVDGVDYNCIIVGDGEIQHFGLIFPNERKAKFNIKCKRLGTVEKEEVVLTEKSQNLLQEEPY
jgi:hypothetical protein